MCNKKYLKNPLDKYDFLFPNVCIDRNKKNISELFFFANLSESRFYEKL